MDGVPRSFGSAADFSMRRVGRIVPIYWFVTSAVFLFWLLSGDTLFSKLGSKTPLLHLLKSLLFWDQDTVVVVGWTLAFEMRFYALAAIAILLVSGLGLRLLLISAILAGAVVTRKLGFHHDLLGKSVVFEFVIGGVIHYGASRLPVRLPAMLGGAALLAGLAALLIFAHNHTLNHGHPLWAVLAGLFVAGAVVAEPWLAWLEKGFAVRLGDASYSLYLVHLYVVIMVEWLVFDVLRLHAALLSACIFCAVSVALIVPLSMLLFSRVEMPLNRLATRRLRREAGVTPPSRAIAPEARFG